MFSGERLDQIIDSIGDVASALFQLLGCWVATFKPLGKHALSSGSGMMQGELAVRTDGVTCAVVTGHRGPGIAR